MVSDTHTSHLDYYTHVLNHMINIICISLGIYSTAFKSGLLQWLGNNTVSVTIGLSLS